MFVNEYNPTYDDIFLYDNTNTGYPIGLNSNHELYPLREYLSAVSLRPRAWTNLNPNYPSGPPVGTPLSQYPNYYNTANPLLWWIDEYNIGGCVHYMGTRPSDSFTDFIKKTTLQDSNLKRFWSDYNFNSTTDYGPVYNIYNCVSSGLTGATAYLIPIYFTGSPEIPGYAIGNTYYQVLSRDFGIIEQVPPKIKRTLKTLKTISITSLAELSGVSYSFGESIKLTSNLYMWDGQDRIVPIELTIHCEFPNKQLNELNFTVEVSGSRVGFSYNGDSSSLILFKHNNALFIVSHITSGGLNPAGYSHNSYFYPINTYFLNNNILKSNWVYSSSIETVGATLGGINNITSLLQTALTTAQAKLAELGS